MKSDKKKASELFGGFDDPFFTCCDTDDYLHEDLIRKYFGTLELAADVDKEKKPFECGKPPNCT